MHPWQVWVGAVLLCQVSGTIQGSLIQVGREGVTLVSGYCWLPDVCSNAAPPVTSEEG